MTTQTGTRTDNVTLAVIVIIGTVLALSLGDAVIKAISAEMVLWQIFVLRSMVALPVLFLILRVRFADVALLPRAPGWTAARSLMLTFMWVAYYASLPHLQLSIAAAAYYTAPILITLFSALFVGERVGRAGWFAVMLGFVGILLILKPAAADFNAYALLPIVSAILYALAMILTRTKCRDEHPLVLAGALNVTFVAVGVAATLLGGFGDNADTSSSFLSATWAPMAGKEYAAVLVLGVLVMLGAVGAAVAYQLGPPSIIATFDFAYVGFAVIWGLVFFAEVPDAVSVAGMALVVVAGVIAVRK